MAEVTHSLEEFRLEVRAWLQAHCPSEMRSPLQDDSERVWGGKRFIFRSEAQRTWTKVMADRGWTVPTWPREYGGGGLTAEQASILRQEMAALKCRVPLESFGIWMLGPALLKYGSEAQKREHLPRIARGEIRWCQGYSEPNAGSDLASLATRAELHGEHFTVNGQKIWTSYADECDWIFCLVRTNTDSKHAGISFLLIDMDSPGVTTRPIRLISGKSPFCETFLDNVRVPRDNVVGEIDGGWAVAKYLLTHEREMVGAIGERAAPPAVHRFALEQIGRDAAGRLDDPVLRAQIAQFEVDEAAFRAWLVLAAEQGRAGEAPVAISSALKYYGAELNKLRWELMMACAGADGLEWEGAHASAGFAARTWLRSKANSIEGGTSEIQLNVIAKRALNLAG